MGMSQNAYSVQGYGLTSTGVLQCSVSNPKLLSQIREKEYLHRIFTRRKKGIENLN